MINEDEYSPTVTFSYKKNKDWFQHNGGGVGFGNDKESSFDNQGYDKFGYDEKGNDREGYRSEDYKEHPYLRNIVAPDYEEITINEVFERLNAAEERYENTRIPELEKELKSIENKIVLSKNMLSTIGNLIKDLNIPSNVVIFKKPLTKEEKERQHKEALEFYKELGVDAEEANLLINYTKDSLNEETLKDDKIYDLKFKREKLEDELLDLELEKTNLEGKISIIKSNQKNKKLTDIVDTNVVKPRKGFSRKR